MVQQSISRRFFNRNLHAIDATPARQHGELLRRHHANTASSCAGTTYEFMQRTLLGLEEYIVGKPAMGTKIVQQGRRRPARRHPHGRRARGLGHDALTTRERRELTSRSFEELAGAPVSLVDLRTGPVGRGALLLRLPDCHREHPLGGLLAPH